MWAVSHWRRGSGPGNFKFSKESSACNFPTNCHGCPSLYIVFPALQRNLVCPMPTAKKRSRRFSEEGAWSRRLRVLRYSNGLTGGFLVTMEGQWTVCRAATDILEIKSACCPACKLSTHCTESKMQLCSTSHMQVRPWPTNIKLRRPIIAFPETKLCSLLLYSSVV